MNMLMRINVTRLFPHQVTKGFELAIYLTLYGQLVFQRDYGIKRRPGFVAANPFTQIEM
jgi:hypothetical protein